MEPVYTCETSIGKSIISNCTTQKVGGLEAKAWIFPRQIFKNSFTFDATYPNKITAITKVIDYRCFTVKGVKKMLNAGYDVIIAEDRADRYIHKFNFQQFEVAAADIANVDALKDVFVVVERKHKTSSGEGTFVAYGVENGLYKTTDGKMENDIDGARNLELATLDGQGEKYSEYTVLNTNYADTLSMLVALESVGVA